jgi:hypothetical protein
MSTTYHYLPFSQRSLPVTLAAFSALSLAFSSTSHAATYTDSQITAATLTANGTVDTPVSNINNLSNYLVGVDYTTAGGLGVGNTYGNHQFNILGGATAETTANTTQYIYGPSQILVDGAGSSLTYGTTTSTIVRTRQSGASITIQNHGSMAIAGSLHLGYEATVTNSSVVVDNGTLTVGAASYIGYISGATGNSMSISNGGQVTHATRVGLGRGGANNNSVTITGAGSIWSLTDPTTSATTSVLRLGENAGSAGTGNTITMASGGALKITNPNPIFISYTSGNYFQFDGGFLAWNGDQTTTTKIANDNVQIWSGSAWVAGVLGSNYTATYYADESAASAAGFSGYGNYTVFTNVVPEPTTLALLGLGGMMISRRRRA